ncbi:hypothetical protein [Rhodococcus sp. USK13]|uniref:hypothetical protein n=1 Tax=Rhodococcus sp. USK13 TaxID=2806442 RepID=UPI001BD1B138|nr:hypothetical protein [Rhodococcus sp. USK13]
MRFLVGCSYVSVLCALLIGVWVLPQLLTKGYVDVGGSPAFEPLFIYPGVVGFVVCIMGAVTSLVLIGRRRLTSVGQRLIAAGQVFTVTLFAACIASLWLPSATGWELLALPGALLIGQTAVGAGLVFSRSLRGN